MEINTNTNQAFIDKYSEARLGIKGASIFYMNYYFLRVLSAIFQWHRVKLGDCLDVHVWYDEHEKETSTKMN